MGMDLYADNAGEPGSLIATTAEKAFTPTSSGHWEELAFTSPPTTAKASSTGSPATPTRASTAEAPTNQNDARRLIAQSYPGGLPDPFGSGSSYNNTRGMKMLVWTNPT